MVHLPEQWGFQNQGKSLLQEHRQRELREQPLRLKLQNRQEPAMVLFEPMQFDLKKIAK
jgi:hypothetical protein